MMDERDRPEDDGEFLSQLIQVAIRDGYVNGDIYSDTAEKILNLILLHGVEWIAKEKARRDAQLKARES